MLLSSGRGKAGVCSSVRGSCGAPVADPHPLHGEQPGPAAALRRDLPAAHAREQSAPGECATHTQLRRALRGPATAGGEGGWPPTL